ncbi:hypothetical protein LZP69_11230 [Shewanella sp. AS1]|uniref:hypothetical protein n=1 Tax=Shewanella sp. AS1 TaxID=2907626 RepID=UPI001F466F69|nr:hypothetical protein [Shewanella sp. AS1]MCE9679735.1 hypothetical protein [Shewanella sp. AS1]
MNSPKKTSRKTLLILLLAFLLPVIAAKLVLSLHLYQGGATNQGELLPPEFSYQSLAMANPHPESWQILYLLPTQCDRPCQDRLYILQQSHIALGKDQDRVTTIVLLQNDSDAKALEGFHFETASSTPELSQLLNEQQLVVVDPLGALVMRYQQVADKEQQIMQGKAMVNDLRKLLKLSRVG